MLNNCSTQNKIPTIWRTPKIIAILQPEKDSAISKSYTLIFLLCHTYKLYECMILNRITPTIEQASFRHVKSCTSQLLNLTQHIEYGYQEGKITGTAFVSLSAVYDIVNRIRLIQTLYNTTQDSKPCRVIQNLLPNRRFYAELNSERSSWRKPKNGLPQGSVIARTLFNNIYTNDQPINNGTRSFIYADDLCITAQYQSFKQVEKTIEEVLDNLTIYYKINSLCANPEKNTSHYKEENKSLKVVWNETELENTGYPKYLGEIKYRWRCYKHHIQNTKMKVATRNNLLTKLTTSKWGANPSTFRMTALALSYSTADYAAPVWAKSSYDQLSP